MIVYKVNEMFWDLNEKNGFRKVRAIHEGECLAIFNSTFLKSTSTWECVMVPMGLTFNQSKVFLFKDVIDNSEKIMDCLCMESLSFEEVQNFISNLQNDDITPE